MTKHHWVVVGIGLTVAAIGIAIGAFVDVKLASGISCGPPWGGTNTSDLFRDLQERCADASQSSNITAWVLTGVGLVTAAVVLLVGYLRKESSVQG
jgi:acetyl-CoA carboxylase alpha subunit